MDKLKMHSVNKVDLNIEKIGRMFPNTLTEVIKGYNDDGSPFIERAIDFDILKQELSSVIIEGKEERYQFTWPDKKKSILMANAPIAKTLRPCEKESVDFDNTENLYIEGDNLDVLKLLQETYLGKIKMIYIDPPYNTGNDFVYADDFSQNTEEYLQNSGQFDGEGNRLFQNTESNGRFHTDWLNMIYPRLKLAKDLLREDGVVFISIDDNEVENLKKICNEVFGERNFEGHIHWRRRHNQPNDKTKMIGIVTEHILSYAKNSIFYKQSGVGKLDLTGNFTNPDNDPKGPWASKPWKVGSDQSGSKYTIITPTGIVLDGEWMGEEATYKQFLSEGRIYFPKGGDGTPRKKYYQFERENEGQCATNWWSHEIFGHNQGANDCMTQLFGKKNIFSNPKPIELLKAIIKISNVKTDNLVLDFFSGSATTAHAIMQLNAEDGGNRKFIMVQLPEDTDEKSECYKAGYKNICEIGKERIRRAGNKIKEHMAESGYGLRKLKNEGETKKITIRREDDQSTDPDMIENGEQLTVTSVIYNTPENLKELNKEMSEKLDIGFRVLKLDSSNMKDVYYAPDKLTIEALNESVNNIKDDRTPLDLLFQAMLEMDVLLSSKIEETEIAGKKVFSVMDDYLIACFDTGITSEVVEAIAKKQPYYAVFRDICMADDSTMTSFDQIFETYSKDTIRKVL